jgi:hypothetical protein
LIAGQGAKTETESHQGALPSRQRVDLEDHRVGDADAVAAAKTGRPSIASTNGWSELISSTICIISIGDSGSARPSTQPARMRRKSCGEASFLLICAGDAPRNALFG